MTSESAKFANGMCKMLSKDKGLEEPNFLLGWLSIPSGPSM